MCCNLLHINSKKCCYMYFPPTRKDRETDDSEEEDVLLLNGVVIKRVTEVKFLGVIIDDKLCWLPHTKSLNTKLRSCCGRLYRLKTALPESMYKEIYHTLFESHLAYGISVWGGISKNRKQPLFVTQKKCIRIMFGDTEAYLDKFRTCARIREYGSQILGQEFFEREHSKPLFTQYSLLTVHNLHRYHCILETYKIIKLRTPISIYGTFLRSTRRDCRLTPPTPSCNFTYTAASLWNAFQQSARIEDFTVPIGSLKRSLKYCLLAAQGRYGFNWCDLNFSEF